MLLDGEIIAYSGIERSKALSKQATEPLRYVLVSLEAGMRQYSGDVVFRALIALFLVIATAPSRAAEVSVTDGDTLILNGDTYRLAGIEAPQTDQTCLDDKGAALDLRHRGTGPLERVCR